MAYGHAERNLAHIRQLEAETAQLLGGVAEPGPEQSVWLRDAEASVSRASSASASAKPSVLPPPRSGNRVALVRGVCGLSPELHAEKADTRPAMTEPRP